MNLRCQILCLLSERPYKPTELVEELNIRSRHEDSDIKRQMTEMLYANMIELTSDRWLKLVPKETI